MPNPPAMTLEELAEQANQNPPANGGEELPDEQAFEQEMANRASAPTPARPRSRSATGITGLPIGPRPAADAAAPIERAPSGVVVQNEDTYFDLVDSQGNDYQITVPAGTRYNVSHGHNGDARRPSCAVCMGIWEHEKGLRQAAAAQSSAGVVTRETLTEETEYDMGADSAGTEWSATIAAGSTIVTKTGHVHSNKRVPTCALCMAIYDHERSIRPAATPKQPKPCECGCGGQTGGRFCPGHDARLYGRVNKYNNWADENADKIASGEIPPTAAPGYDQLPEAVLTSGQLVTGHGVIQLRHHPLTAAA
jgi:hypothetical protein